MAGRILLVVAVAFGAHLVALGLRAALRGALRSGSASESKIQTLTGFFTSVALFTIWFVAVGRVLNELGISLAAYLAGASVIGLAVSFGSQGVVQDVITGLTVVFADLIDVGDMVEIAGQTGIVQEVGIRFTVLVGFTGARVFIPNRTITNVINYPRGYVRAYLDVRLVGDAEKTERCEEVVRRLAEAAHEQFPGILLLPPTVEGRQRSELGEEWLRTKFRIWPGQGAILEGFLRQNVVQALRKVDESYADWMVAIFYRAEPRDGDPQRRLPRPAALRQREHRDARSHE